MSHLTLPARRLVKISNHPLNQMIHNASTYKLTEWAAIDSLPARLRAKKVAVERRDLRDSNILRNANGQVVVWYQRDANEPGIGEDNTPEQVRARYQGMKNTNFMAEIRAVMVSNWGVVTIED